MIHFLISIIPSEDITVRIRKLRTLIFKKFGLISARCLPEMIPVAFVHNFIDKELFKGLTINESLAGSNCGTTSGNDIFLSIKNTEFINKIKSTLAGSVTTGIFTLMEGFYLGTANTDSEIKDILDCINQESGEILAWEKNSLELIRIETANEVWWESIKWETLWAQRISTR